MSARLDVALLKSMARSEVRDYVIPGLTSALIGGEGKGMVRLFSQERHHEEPITPHSHRFDFNCLVLAGHVRNRTWFAADDGDPYQESVLEHHGQFGDQTRRKAVGIQRWAYTETTYFDGEVYAMRAEEIHSIYFGRDAEVLFFEGPSHSSTSVILEPVSGGRVIPTFRVDPWMFRRDAA